MVQCSKCRVELTESSIRIEKSPCETCPSGYTISVFCSSCGKNVTLEAFTLVREISEKRVS